MNKEMITGLYLLILANILGAVGWIIFKTSLMIISYVVSTIILWVALTFCLANEKK